jgi:SAM-dependent MidA family methyltransferase
MTYRLKQKILAQIDATGPMPVGQYMHLCHAHPQFGYYATGNPVGREGDFITAPEISQMFGEMIAIWAISAWQAIGSPNRIQIAELGPGRATLMRDFIRTAAAHQEFFQAMQIKMVETSPSLKKQQRELLGDSDVSCPIDWLDTLDQLDALPTLFIANEFLDAIPFRQFVKTQNGWLEVCVGRDETDEPNGKGEELAFVIGPTGIDESTLPQGHKNEPEGAVFEYAPAREAFVALIAEHLSANDGAALLIDYGHAKSGFGDTFQAVKSHKSVSPLQDPGNCDLTSHVDFQAIGETALDNGVHVTGLLSQADFLIKLGLLERAGSLGGNKGPELQKQIEKDVERLVSPEQMGDLFKVLCLAKHQYNFPPFAE